MALHISAFPDTVEATFREDGSSQMLRFRSEDRFGETDVYLTYLSSAELRSVAKVCLRQARALDRAEAARIAQEEDHGPKWLEDVL